MDNYAKEDYEHQIHDMEDDEDIDDDQIAEFKRTYILKKSVEDIKQRAKE
jgi:hypothetical protein